MNNCYSFIYAFCLCVYLIQFQSFATKIENCGVGNSKCWKTDDCCTGLKCYYANAGEQLQGFCESPNTAEKANKIERKVETHLRQ